MRISLLIFALFMIVFGCNENINHPEITRPNFPFADTLECKVTPGVKMKLININDIYEIDNALTCQIKLSNLSDTSIFPVYFPIWPAYSFTIYDENNLGVGGGPESVSLTEVRYNLNIGDSFTYDVWWAKNTYSKVKYGIEFPAFTGNYLLKFGISGNTNFNNKYLYKWINIKESGEQSVFIFQNSYEQADIAILDMAMRNRFSSEVNYHFKDSANIILYIISPITQDTVFSKSIDFSDLSFKVPALSDTLLFSYRLDKTEQKFQNLNGLYDIKAEIKFIEKNISLKSFINFYN
jgi:hypothetical protein